MVGELYYNFADLYPSMGYTTTRSLTNPEAGDQNTLVDDEQLAQTSQVQHNPATSRNILVTIFIIIIVAVLLGWKF